MEMTECLELAYIERMSIIRAEQTINAAQVALYPKMEKTYAKKWMGDLLKQVQRTFHDVGMTFNGKEISADNLKKRLKNILGGGFS